MNYIFEEIEQYKKYDIDNYHRDTPLHVRDAEKMCEFIKGMAEYVVKLELRINELEEKLGFK